MMLSPVTENVDVVVWK